MRASFSKLWPLWILCVAGCSSRQRGLEFQPKVTGLVIQGTDGQGTDGQGADGAPVPSLVGQGQALMLVASDGVTHARVYDARWSGTGPCTLGSSYGPTSAVEPLGVGTCTITAAAQGVAADATFTVVALDGVKLVGDASPLSLDEVRTFSAVALAGTTEVPSTPIAWSLEGEGPVTLGASGNVAMISARAVGRSRLEAVVPLGVFASVDLDVEPTSIQLAATYTRVTPHTSTFVLARPVGPNGVVRGFASAAQLVVAGATGFGSVSFGQPVPDGGSVRFDLVDAMIDSPNVTVTYGAIVSNAVSFVVGAAFPRQVGHVTVTGSTGTVTVGSDVALDAVLQEPDFMSYSGTVPVTWTDPNGVLVFPDPSTSTHVQAHVAKLGNAAVVATAMGVASLAVRVTALPASVLASAFSPSSVLVGGAATMVVSVVDVTGAPVPNATLQQVSLEVSDSTQVSAGRATLVGAGFQFTATGLEPTSALGDSVTAIWSDGVWSVLSEPVSFVVTPP